MPSASMNMIAWGAFSRIEDTCSCASRIPADSLSLRRRSRSSTPKRIVAVTATNSQPLTVLATVRATRSLKTRPATSSDSTIHRPAARAYTPASPPLRRTESALAHHSLYRPRVARPDSTGGRAGHLGYGSSGPGWSSAGPSHSGSTTGTLTVNVAPCPSSLSRVMSPPRPRARRRLIARPSPVPCALPASGRATWWNSSKTASWSASGIPGPSSLAVATVQYRGTVIDSEQRDVALRLTPYTSALGNVVSARVGIVTGLQQFVAVTLPSGPSTDSFRPFAAGLYSGAPGVRAIQVARGDIIEFMRPVTGNEAAIGLSLLTDPRAAVRADVR